MSRLNELIKELCPDGVEYRELHEVLTIKNGSDYKQFGTGNIPVYGSGGIMTYIDRYAYNKPSVLIPRKGSIDKLYYVEEPFWNVDTIFYTDIDVSQVIPRFVYFCLQMEHLEQYNTAGGVPSLTQKVLNKIKLPVPPLEVQREIVRVLDSFTLLTAELTAELTARKKQYNFYRDTLIQKECKSEKVKLNTICEIYDGTHQTPQYTNSGIPFVSVENIDDLYRTQKFISPEAYAKYKIKPRTGDVFMTRITAGVIGKCTVVDRDDDLAYYVSLALLRPNADILDGKYLKYYLESGWGRRELSKWILWDATPTKINKDDIGRVLISVPPLDTQKRLVQVIEHFDAICTDLNIGLPAEIEARQKQYEYYRDLLLTFAETGSIIPAEQSRAEQSRAEQSRAEQSRAEQSRAGLIKLIQYVFGYVQIQLSDVGRVSMCKRIMKAETSSSGDVPFYKIGTFGKEADAFISREKFEEYRNAYSYPKKGDILISAAGTIGRAVVYNGEDAYYQDSNIVWIDNNESIVLNRYLFYCYQLQPWVVSTGGTIARLYNDNISKAKIIVPNIEHQKQIIAILDRFDILCNDLSNGLPAEIEARKKQYEYYRDKLLNFKEVK